MYRLQSDLEVWSAETYREQGLGTLLGQLTELLSKSLRAL